MYELFTGNENVSWRLCRPATSQEVKRLIRCMVERDPKKRIKMEEICQQPWVAQASPHCTCSTILQL